MKLLVTGSTGFIGQHLLKSLQEQVDSEKIAITTSNSHDVDILSPGAADEIMSRFKPTHVLHLAWSSTKETNYDLGIAHQEWNTKTFSLMADLAKNGVVNWGIGTGLENEVRDQNLSPYGVAKLNLKERVLTLDDPCLRWISLPYVFSVFHQRPRVVKSCFELEKLSSPTARHDYLEIRDVVSQLCQIILHDDSRLTSVSSGVQISNESLCFKVQELKYHDLFNSCSCIDAKFSTLPNPRDSFTSYFLD